MLLHPCSLQLLFISSQMQCIAISLRAICIQEASHTLFHPSHIFVTFHKTVLFCQKPDPLIRQQARKMIQVKLFWLWKLVTSILTQNDAFLLQHYHWLPTGLIMLIVPCSSMGENNTMLLVTFLKTTWPLATSCRTLLSTHRSNLEPNSHFCNDRFRIQNQTYDTKPLHRGLYSRCEASYIMKDLYFGTKQWDTFEKDVIIHKCIFSLVGVHHVLLSPGNSIYNDLNNHANRSMCTCVLRY